MNDGERRGGKEGQGGSFDEGGGGCFYSKWRYRLDGRGLVDGAKGLCMYLLTMVTAEKACLLAKPPLLQHGCC